MDQWHYFASGKQHGPVAAEEILRLINAGELQKSDSVWREGMSGSSPIWNTTELTSLLADSGSTRWLRPLQYATPVAARTGRLIISAVSVDLLKQTRLRVLTLSVALPIGAGLQIILALLNVALRQGQSTMEIPLLIFSVMAGLLSIAAAILLGKCASRITLLLNHHLESTLEFALSRSEKSVSTFIATFILVVSGICAIVLIPFLLSSLFN